MANDGTGKKRSTGGENFLIEWTIENFSSWSMELHQIGINSPRSELLPNLTIDLYPRGTNGSQKYMTLLFTSRIPAKEGSLCGDVTLAFLDGAMIWRQRLEQPRDLLFVHLHTNLEFTSVAQCVWDQGDKIVLRYRTRGPFNKKKEELRTNIFALNRYIMLYPQDLLGLDTTGMKLGSIRYQLYNGQKEEIELWGRVKPQVPSKISLLLVLKNQARVERPVFVLARLCAKRDSAEETIRGHFFRLDSKTTWRLGALERVEVGEKVLVLAVKITPRTGYTHTISPQKNIEPMPPHRLMASTSDIDASQSNLLMPAGANGYDQGIRTLSGNIDTNLSNLVMPAGASGHDQGTRMSLSYIDSYQPNLLTRARVSGHYHDQTICATSDNIDANRPNLPTSSDASGHDQELRASTSYMHANQPNLPTPDSVSGHDPREKAIYGDDDRDELHDFQSLSGESNPGHNELMRSMLSVFKARRSELQMQARLSVHDQGILTGSDNSNTNGSNLPMPGSVSEHDQGIRTSAGNIDSNPSNIPMATSASGRNQQNSDNKTSDKADDIVLLHDLISHLRLNSEDGWYKLL